MSHNMKHIVLILYLLTWNLISKKKHSFLIHKISRFFSICQQKDNSIDWRDKRVKTDKEEQEISDTWFLCMRWSHIIEVEILIKGIYSDKGKDSPDKLYKEYFYFIKFCSTREWTLEISTWTKWRNQKTRRCKNFW